MYYIYMMTNWNNKVLYIGVTSDLEKRINEHKYKEQDGFTKKYNINKLVYYEETHNIDDAIAREKQLKKWTRAKKNKLIESINKDWKDLSL